MSENWQPSSQPGWPDNTHLAIRASHRQASEPEKPHKKKPVKDDSDDEVVYATNWSPNP